MRILWIIVYSGLICFLTACDKQDYDVYQYEAFNLNGDQIAGGRLKINMGNGKIEGSRHIEVISDYEVLERGTGPVQGTLDDGTQLTLYLFVAAAVQGPYLVIRGEFGNMITTGDRYWGSTAPEQKIGTFKLTRLK